MRKRIALIMVTVSVLLMAGCGASNSAEGPVGVDSQMVENAGQFLGKQKRYKLCICQTVV